MVKYKLRVASYKLLVTSWKLQSTGWNSKVRVQTHEFKVTSYEFKSTSYKFKSTSSRIILSIKAQVNSLKISSFLNILSLKLFGSSWRNSSVQFLVIISCFYFSIISTASAENNVNINFKRRDLTSAQKSHRFPDDFGDTFAFNLIK